MKQYLCSVKLGDSNNHIVTNKVVTVPEIAVLKMIHGDAAVIDIRPCKDIPIMAGKKQAVDEFGEEQWAQRADADRTDAEERERLVQHYDNAMPGEVVVGRLFPPLQPLPKNLTAIGIDPKAAAADMRRQAAALAASAAMLDDEPQPLEDDLDAAFDEDDEKAA